MHQTVHQFPCLDFLGSSGDTVYPHAEKQRRVNMVHPIMADLVPQHSQNLTLREQSESHAHSAANLGALLSSTMTQSQECYEIIDTVRYDIHDK